MDNDRDVSEALEHDDLLEALRWFRRKAERAPVGGVPTPDRLIEEREQVVTRYLSQKEKTINDLRSEIRDLRERLEEVREERDRWKNTEHQLRDEATMKLDRLRRQRDELREALDIFASLDRVIERELDLTEARDPMDRVTVRYRSKTYYLKKHHLETARDALGETRTDDTVDSEAGGAGEGEDA